MTETALKQNAKSSEEDFQKAQKFFLAIDQEYKETYSKLTLTFPQKYQDKNKFLEEFKDLDDVEKLGWFDHHLKEAYNLYTKRDGAQQARKNILWSLMLCRQFNISLASRDYQWMKMIKHIWYKQSQNQQQAVKDKLKQILINKLGQKQLIPIKQTKPTTNQSNSKKQGMCGCAGDFCLIM